MIVWLCECECVKMKISCWWIDIRTFNVCRLYILNERHVGDRKCSEKQENQTIRVDRHKQCYEWAHNQLAASQRKCVKWVLVMVMMMMVSSRFVHWHWVFAVATVRTSEHHDRSWIQLSGAEVIWSVIVIWCSAQSLQKSFNCISIPTILSSI